MTSPLLEPAAAAQRFLAQSGRDIDLARFHYHVEGSISQDDLMNVLARYQAADGGFTGLEVDIEAPCSNPFATELALVIMRWANVAANHPLLARTVAHLEESQAADGGWRFDEAVYRHGLAPWFQGWTWPNLNPTCTLAGLLRQLAVGSTRLHQRAQALFERMSSPLDLTSTEFYAARPYALYLQAEGGPPQTELYRWGVVWWLIRQHALGDLDATHWVEYAPAPASAVARRLPSEVVAAQLARLRADQQPDGGWPTPYNPAWRPWITMNNLLTLQAYQRAA